MSRSRPLLARTKNGRTVGVLEGMHDCLKLDHMALRTRRNVCPYSHHYATSCSQYSNTRKTWSLPFPRNVAEETQLDARAGAAAPPEEK